ncbi:MAG: Dabb family protein [Phycisphaerales bacterium]|nr:MAG: Dabb family protein [Phycisphaerales bacterium]
MVRTGNAMVLSIWDGRTAAKSRTMTAPAAAPGSVIIVRTEEPAPRLTFSGFRPARSRAAMWSVLEMRMIQQHLQRFVSIGRRLVLVGVVASAPVVYSAGCAATGDPLPPRPAAINHFVVFKLNDPADAAELIEDCDRYLGRIPGVVSYFAGQHHDIGRDTVFRDYDVGFFVGFDSDEAYRAYVDHPEHVRIVNKWRDRWEWYRVYDVFDDGSRE